MAKGQEEANSFGSMEAFTKATGKITWLMEKDV
jgi:hypothetical protein